MHICVLAAGDVFLFPVLNRHACREHRSNVMEKHWHCFCFLGIATKKKKPTAEDDGREWGGVNIFSLFKASVGQLRARAPLRTISNRSFIGQRRTEGDCFSSREGSESYIQRLIGTW